MPKLSAPLIVPWSRDSRSLTSERFAGSPNGASSAPSIPTSPSIAPVGRDRDVAAEVVGRAVERDGEGFVDAEARAPVRDRELIGRRAVGDPRGRGRALAQRRLQAQGAELRVTGVAEQRGGRRGQRALERPPRRSSRRSRTRRPAGPSSCSRPAKFTPPVSSTGSRVELACGRGQRGGVDLLVGAGDGQARGGEAHVAVGVVPQRVDLGQREVVGLGGDRELGLGRRVVGPDRGHEQVDALVAAVERRQVRRTGQRQRVAGVVGIRA